MGLLYENMRGAENPMRLGGDHAAVMDGQTPDITPEQIATSKGRCAGQPDADMLIDMILGAPMGTR